jgi:hypothetical protein
VYFQHWQVLGPMYLLLSWVTVVGYVGTKYRYTAASLLSFLVSFIDDFCPASAK